MAGLDDQSDVPQQSEGSRQLAVGEVIAHLAPFACCPHQAAAAQAGEMVGNVGPTLTYLIGELGRIRRTVDQPNKDPSTHTIGHRGADTTQRFEPCIEADICRHTATIVQPLL